MSTGIQHCDLVYVEGGGLRNVRWRHDCPWKARLATLRAVPTPSSNERSCSLLLFARHSPRACSTTGSRPAAHLFTIKRMPQYRGKESARGAGTTGTRYQTKLNRECASSPTLYGHAVLHPPAVFCSERQRRGKTRTVPVGYRHWPIKALLRVPFISDAR